MTVQLKVADVLCDSDDVKRLKGYKIMHVLHYSTVVFGSPQLSHSELLSTQRVDTNEEQRKTSKEIPCRTCYSPIKDFIDKRGRSMGHQSWLDRLELKLRKRKKAIHGQPNESMDMWDILFRILSNFGIATRFIV